MSDFKPLHDNVLILQRKTKHSGTIQLITEEVTNIGDVIAVGPGYVCEATGEFIATNVKVGDVVMFGQSVGQPVTIDGHELGILRERDLFGILIENEVVQTTPEDLTAE